MKALLLTAERTLELTDVPAPECGPEDVLVRVRACGVCGSDVHGYDGSSGRRRPPLVMGHEAAGVVEWVGERVGERASGIVIGDRVTFDSTVWCGRCGPCRAGRVNLCDERRVLGVSCEEYRRHGAFAELVAVPERIVYRLPDRLSFEHAAMVEAVSVAVHAVGRTPIRLGDTVVVIGAGMIGLLILQAARLAGAGRVVVVDLAHDRLELARRLGADEVVQPGEDGAAAILEAVGPQGADVVFEAVGVAPTVSAVIHAARKGGSVTLVGNVTATVDLPLQAVVTRELTLIGSCASAGEYPACLELLAAGKINVEPLISATPPLAEGAEWFDRLYRGEAGLLKVILRP
ncbi:galactitol-1-phosphate 5-dehydrogenase [Botrimarina sp.]|uniref:galactitol-1-phosphate 5-dehydrogenase n=1 Tax=Botrimarina sp. TaxID=2795802 RepID=UPI0032ED198E